VIFEETIVFFISFLMFSLSILFTFSQTSFIISSFFPNHKATQSALKNQPKKGIFHKNSKKPEIISFTQVTA